ncbi:MAG: GNAT family N-acetyltransferase [Halanaeroarchaeum sp.]
MYVRDAKNREEVWLLDRLEEFDFEDPAFRSRDYVIAIDEEEGQKVGFGRIRAHTTDGEFCELRCIGVLPEWRGSGVGAHLLERLVELARDQGFETVFVFTAQPEYFDQFGFDRVDSTALSEAQQNRLDAVSRRRGDDAVVAMRTSVGAFSIPSRLRRRYERDEEESPTEHPEDFGIDPSSASYKYDTGR